MTVSQSPGMQLCQVKLGKIVMVTQKSCSHKGTMHITTRRWCLLIPQTLGLTPTGLTNPSKKPVFAG